MPEGSTSLRLQGETNMSAAVMFRSVINRQLCDLIGLNIPVSCQIQSSRNAGMWRPDGVPKPGVKGKSWRRIVHFNDTYTVEPLEVTNMAGRDPVSGRTVAKGIGGGIKHKYHWIKWIRDGPKDVDEPPKEEKVLHVFKDGCRTSLVALVGHGKEMKYILATENMKPGQIIRTSQAIPRIPVRALEGDAYPLGALPVGTKVNCVEKYPGLGGFLIHAAGAQGTIMRKEDTNVIVQMPSKKLFSLDQYCMATVGRLSNIDHGETPIGSAQANRLLGNRPRSGLWQRKDGRHGRKIRNLPPVRKFESREPENPDLIHLTLVV